MHPLTYTKIILYTKARQKSARHFLKRLNTNRLQSPIYSIFTHVIQTNVQDETQKRKPLRTDMLCFVQKPYIAGGPAGLSLHTGNWRGSSKSHVHLPMPVMFLKKVTRHWSLIWTDLQAHDRQKFSQLLFPVIHEIKDAFTFWKWKYSQGMAQGASTQKNFRFQM